MNGMLLQRFLLLASYIGLTAFLSYALAFVSARWAIRAGAIDKPTGGRKIHTRSTPLWGGLGITLALFAGVLLAWLTGSLTSISVQPMQIMGFLVGAVLILAVGLLDDRYDLPVWSRFVVYVFACVIVVMTGTGIVQVTRWAGVGGFSLVWKTMDIMLPGLLIHLSLPADLVTLAWLVLVLFATKFLDGLDGLVTGQTVIGSLLIVALTMSAAYFQPTVALIAAIIAGAFFGFLPHNAHPARHFLGESGSVLAGFCLGFLSILSSAKVAIALSVLTISIVDIGIVVIGRFMRGAPIGKGDATHLHHRLLQAGLGQRKAVFLLWGVSAFSGVIALSLQTRGKFFLVLVLAILTIAASWITHRMSGCRGK